MPKPRRVPPGTEAGALSRRNSAALAALRHGWGEFYRLGVEWPDRWSAEPLDGGETLTAGDPVLLREAIIADHESRPFPRPLPRQSR